MERHEAPRSFKVKTEVGQILRRNRKFLRQSKPTQTEQAAQPELATGTEVIHPVRQVSPSTTPRKIPSETTTATPAGPSMSTPQSPIRRVSERQRNKPK